MWEIIWIPKSRLKFRWTLQTTRKSLQIQRSENHKVGHQKKLIPPSSWPLAMRTSDLLTNFALLPSPQPYSLCGAWPSPCSCSRSPWAMAVAPDCTEHSPTAPPHHIKREQTLDKKGAYHQFSGGCHPISHPKNDPSLSMERLSQPSDSFSNLGIPSTSPGPLLWEAFLTPTPGNGASASQCPYSPCASWDLHL